VPVSLVYRKGLKKDGSAPLYQTAYGAYGSSSDPEFDLSAVSLLNRGFVYAIAHVRGGQELGRAWYEDGRLLTKRNTFTDSSTPLSWCVRNGQGQGVRGDRAAASDRLDRNLAPERYRRRGHVLVDAVTTMLTESPSPRTSGTNGAIPGRRRTTTTSCRTRPTTT
jgi:oligopeptidase B